MGAIDEDVFGSTHTHTHKYESSEKERVVFTESKNMGVLRVKGASFFVVFFSFALVRGEKDALDTYDTATTRIERDLF